MKNVPTRKDVFNFLTKHSVAVLATVSEKHAPHASAMYFVVDEELNFFFLTKSSTRRFLHIQTNDQVAIVVSANNSPQSVQIEGKASIISDPWQQRNIVNQVAEKSASQGKKFWPPPVSQLQDGEIAILKVTPTVCCYCDFFGGEPGRAKIAQVI